MHLVLLIIFIFLILTKLIDCDCKNDENRTLIACFTEDNLKIMCLCEEFNDKQNSAVDKTICESSYFKFLECYFKPNAVRSKSEHWKSYLVRKPIEQIKNQCDCLNESMVNENRSDTRSFDQTTISQSIFDLNKQKELDAIKLDQRLAELERNSSLVFEISKYFEAKYFILISFLISLFMILIVWCLLNCCQCTQSSNLSASDLFVSSTPINNYSPINSTNISPISLHDDPARAVLLEDSLYSVDVPLSYEDIKPPSYQEACSNYKSNFK